MGRSASTSATPQNTADNRLVTDNGSFGNTGTLSAGNVTVSSADADLIKRAYDYLDKSNALDYDKMRAILSSSENTGENIIDAAAGVYGDTVNAADSVLGYTQNFVDSLLASAENSRKDSFKAGSDAITASVDAVAGLTKSAANNTFDNSQIIAALIGAGALFLVTRH